MIADQRQGMEKFARSAGEPRDIGRSFSHGDCNGREKRTSLLLLLLLLPPFALYHHRWRKTEANYRDRGHPEDQREMSRWWKLQTSFVLSSFSRSGGIHQSLRGQCLSQLDLWTCVSLVTSGAWTFYWNKNQLHCHSFVLWIARNCEYSFENNLFARSLYSFVELRSTES